jgi:hypothetical protein
VALEIFSQGGAFVHNLVAGALRLEPVIDRATPYHRPHSTQVSGYAVIHGGDDRYIGNLFLGGDADLAFRPGSQGHRLATYGTTGYDGYPATFAAYLAALTRTDGDHTRFHGVKQPAYIHHNAYANGATPYEEETDAVVVQERVSLSVVDEGAEVYVEIELPQPLTAAVISPITTGELPRVRLADADFEEPDGSPVALHTDLVGNRKEQGAAYPAGPLSTLSGGSARIRVW